MKKFLLFILFVTSWSSYSQNHDITSLEAVPSATGLNVSLTTVSYNGAGFLNHSYVITDNIITLKVCYWFNVTLPVLTFHHDFFIPVNFTQSNYVLVVELHNSVSVSECDDFGISDTATLAFLSTKSFATPKNDMMLYPNPTNGSVYLKNDDLNIRSFGVFDALGRKVKSFSDFSRNKFDLNDLNDGIYLVNLATENGNFSQKIVVKK